MGRPQQVTDAEILETARDFFIKEGANVSTEKIAHALGVSQPVLFKRFKSKKELMMAAIGVPEMDSWFTDLQKQPDNRPFGVQLLEMAEEITTFLKKALPAMMVLRSCGMNPEDMMHKHAVSPPVMEVKVLSNWLASCYTKGLIIKADYSAMAKGILGGLHFPMVIHFLQPQSSLGMPDMSYVATIMDVYITKLSLNKEKGV